MKEEGINVHPLWDEAHEFDWYFYEKVTESYLPDCRVDVVGHGPMLMLGSYSYLSLNGHPRINQAAADALTRYGTGSSGVRLLAGTLDIHKQLEERIARFKCAPTAVTFSSGFLANLSTIAAVVERHDVVICDKLDHASIVDGCQLSKAEMVRFRHNDMAHLEACLERHKDRRRKLVIVDAVFSMDGDIIDLPEVVRLCRRYDALLMVDEAHAIGVLGATGHGIEEHFGVPEDAIDIKMGTLSKAIPSVGGYVATRQYLADAIRLKARGFIYSASLPAASAAAAIAALDVIEDEPDHVQRLHANMAHFRQALLDADLCFGNAASAVFPIMCGDERQALRLAHYCQTRGIYVQAIVHPIVPVGAARLRACVCADHKVEDLDFCVEVIREGAESMGILPGQPQNR